MVTNVQTGPGWSCLLGIIIVQLYIWQTAHVILKIKMESNIVAFN